MESKHTTGTWEIQAPSNFANRRGLIANGIKHTVLEDYTGTEEAEANAKLISCAPDMAKMLSDEIKLLDRFMKMLPGEGIMWHEMKERKKFIKILLDKATF